MTNADWNMTPTQIRAEAVLKRHRIPNENKSYRMGERPLHVIEAIIRDIQAVNAAAEGKQ